jgi:hypothetical protein
MHKRRHRSTAANSAANRVTLALPVILFGLGGLVFCLLGGVYASQAIDDWQNDTIQFAIGSSWGTGWHRSYP